MFNLARVENELENYSRAGELLDELIEHNPDFKNADAHLLYARVQASLGNTIEALHEYETLVQYYCLQQNYRYST